MTHRLCAWGRKVLSPDLYARTLGAAEADLQHELALRPDDAPALRRRARWTFLWLLLGALWLDRRDAARHLPWWLMATPLAAIGLGAIGIALTEGTGLLVAQATFVGVALVLGALMATTPRRLLAHGATTAAWLAILVIAIVALTTPNPGRWLSLGPLQIHIAALTLPCFALGFSERLAHAHPTHALALLAAMQGALALSADTTTSATVTAIALALAGSSPQPRWRVPTVALVGLAAAAVRDPLLTPVAHSEGVVGLMANLTPLMAAAGVLALLGVAAAPLIYRRQTARAPDPWARGMALSLALLLVVPTVCNTFVPSVVPLLGYSGSAVVATYLALGAWMALDARRAVAATS